MTISYKEASELVDWLCDLIGPKLPNIVLRGEAAVCQETTGSEAAVYGQIDAWPEMLAHKVLDKHDLFTVLRPSFLEPAPDQRAMVRFDCNEIKDSDLNALAELIAESLAKSLGEYE